MKSVITFIIFSILLFVSDNLPARSLRDDLSAMAQNGQYKMMLCAHRGNTATGYEQDAPVSSLAALDIAVARGIDMIEVDARSTQDGVIVNMHDPDIKAFTNGAGVLSNMTYEQVLKYRLKTPSGKVSDEPVHTFREMLEAAKGKIYVFVDIKVTEIGRQMYEIAKDLDMMDQIVWYISTSTKSVGDEIYACDNNAIICPYVSTASKLKSYLKSYKLLIAHTALDKLETADNLLETFEKNNLVAYANHLDFDSQIYPSANPDYSYLERMATQNIGFIQSDVGDVIAGYAIKKGYRENTSSIETIKINDAVVRTAYYDLEGREHIRPLPGKWMIKKNVYDGGLSDTEIYLCR